MDNFVFQNETKILFGRGTEAEVGKETLKYAKKILLHYGGSNVKKSGLLEKVKHSLNAAGIEYIELGGVVPNPRLSLVYEGIHLCREAGIEFILAVGGGSVIDSAKAIAIGVPYSGDVWDFYEKKAPVKEMLPVGVVLTIPAAGSEASNGSVITKEEGWQKRDAGGACMRPKFAIMNPELTFTLPAYQTACGAADIMAHIFERYFTPIHSVDLTDRLCEAALKTVIRHVPIVLAYPTDYDARAEIMWAGTIAHNDLLGTGRTGDWASHMIEHELSALYDVAHGAGLAVVFPAWMQYVYKTDIRRFAQFAHRVWDVEYDFEAPERTAQKGISMLKAFFKEIGLPVSLKDLGIPDERLDEMAQRCTSRGNLGNFVKLDKAAVLSILNIAR